MVGTFVWGWVTGSFVGSWGSRVFGEGEPLGKLVGTVGLVFEVFLVLALTFGSFLLWARLAGRLSLPWWHSW